MSLRKIAKELGISPAYLGYMVNGKRPWNPSLHQRYLQLVNTRGSIVNTEEGGQLTESAQRRKAPHACITLAGARGSRTHRPDRRAGANGFEVREAHQDPFAPAGQGSYK